MLSNEIDRRFKPSFPRHERRYNNKKYNGRTKAINTSRKKFISVFKHFNLLNDGAGYFQKVGIRQIHMTDFNLSGNWTNNIR
jgi:hypothetical protein